MRGREQSPLGLYTIGIAALFLAGFFLLVLFGAGNYRNTVQGQNDNMTNRALRSYLATVIRGYDSVNAIKAEESEYGPALIILDGDSGYALRIYKYEDKLLEDYGPAGSKLNPRNAQTIGKTGLFELKRPSADILAITTDAGCVRLHLRSEGGSAQ